jgi:MarR family transcriptional regulator, 2-MHQ and catechol-resistance regulon repressor
MPQTGEDTSGVHVWLILMKAYRSLFSHAHASIGDLGLCDSDFFVLEVLLHKGPLPVNIVGQKVDLTSGSISIAIDRLVHRGLVERCDFPEDKRVRVVQLTDMGRQLIETAFQKHAVAMEQAGAGLDPTERTQLMALLRKLGKTAEASFPNQSR